MKNVPGHSGQLRRGRTPLLFLEGVPVGRGSNIKISEFLVKNDTHQRYSNQRPLCSQPPGKQGVVGLCPQESKGWQHGRECVLETGSQKDVSWSGFRQAESHRELHCGFLCEYDVLQHVNIMLSDLRKYIVENYEHEDD